MGFDKRLKPGGVSKRVSSYQRIPKQPRPRSRSLSLLYVLLWAGLGITALIAFDRSRNAQVPASPASGLAISEAPVVDQPEPMPLPAVTSVPPERGEFTPVREIDANPLSNENQMAEEPAKPDTTVSVTLQRDRAGNYLGMGMINRKAVRMLIDTGASMVIIPEPLANRLGLKKGEPMMFRTGGGMIVHYATMLDTLSIGAIRISDVPAAINPHMQEDFALLGMSALALLRFRQEGNNLVLSYDPGTKAGQGTDSLPPEPIRFRRSVKECMGEGRTIDRKTLDCLRGN